MVSSGMIPAILKGRRLPRHRPEAPTSLHPLLRLCKPSAPCFSIPGPRTCTPAPSLPCRVSLSPQTLRPPFLCRGPIPLTSPLPVSQDEEQRKKRAERFGIDYQEPDLTGLKEAGKRPPFPSSPFRGLRMEDKGRVVRRYKGESSEGDRH